LPKCFDDAARDQHSLVGCPCRGRGSFNHHRNIESGGWTHSQGKSQFAGMIGRGLAPQAVIRQGLHRDADLLGDEDDQIIWKAAAIEHLRHCHARVPQQCQLQRNAKAIVILPALKDQIDIHRLEGIKPDEIIPVLRNVQKLLSFVITQKFMLMHPDHALLCPQKANSIYGQGGVKRRIL
jgi:hypothetical protein